MNDDRVLLEIEIDNESIDVNKQDILTFFKNLKIMPTIDKELVYQNILNNNIDLPKFEFEEYYLNFCAYKTKDNKELIIIKDVGSDNYYYIYLEHVFKCSIFEAGKIFYENIAQATGVNADEVHDTLADKLGSYESILLSSYNKYLSSLDDFIEDNIYMFNAALKEKQDKVKSKSKNHTIR